MTRSNFIRVQGAREHNLSNISLAIPRDSLVVITGVSGSGKSSLAFDTIYAEGQRRYVESLSSYARQFLGIMEKPDVDSIEGLSPAISIEQKTTHRNPRSTVGTVTEIYDYLRLLFARAGEPHCHQCKRPVKAVSTDQIVARALAFPLGSRLHIIAPLAQNKKGSHKEILERMQKEGFSRMRINGEYYDLHQDAHKIKLPKNKKHNLDLVVDRLILKEGIRSRMADSIEIALRYAKGMVCIFDGKEDHFFTQQFYCSYCDISLNELSPRSFSFNSPIGACPECDGLGLRMEFDPDAIVPDKHKSISEGCIELWSSSLSYGHLEVLAEYGIALDIPWEHLPLRHRKLLLYGSASLGEKTVLYFEGIIPNAKRRYRETKSEAVRPYLQRYMLEQDCAACGGGRLRPEALGVLYHGKTITELTHHSVEFLSAWFCDLSVSEQEKHVVGQVLQEICQRLRFLDSVGVGYLNLARLAGSLSGGEAQRIRLATQIGSPLMGVLYVLDEPSIGLHQRDNDRLIQTLKNMRDLGNTVLVVEHDEDTMRAADCIVDIGPGAGMHGGKVVAIGRAEEIQKDDTSITGQYLSGKRYIAVPSERRPGKGKYLSVLKAKANNLRSVDAHIPLGTFTCVTGLSGSGKSTLVSEILYKGLTEQDPRHLRSRAVIRGAKELDRVLLINQEPIGRTPRSNPATYTGLFGPVRELFSKLPEARLRGYAPGRFSFNVAGGRCENCEGAGVIKIEMHFLPDVYVDCEVCGAMRFNQETLEVRYKGASIYDVLDMTVDKALRFFGNINNIHTKLQTLVEVGLGYIQLGQPATTLSGGEAQRVKLSAELSRRSTGQSLYILDEPTSGLHFEDIARLLRVLHSLVNRGNTVLVIEHNLDVIKTADYIIDLGPEGGDKGGSILASGTPEEITQCKASHTGSFLKNILAKSHYEKPSWHIEKEVL